MLCRLLSTKESYNKRKISIAALMLLLVVLCRIPEKKTDEVNVTKRNEIPEKNDEPRKVLVKTQNYPKVIVENTEQKDIPIENEIPVTENKKFIGMLLLLMLVNNIAKLFGNGRDEDFYLFKYNSANKKEKQKYAAIIQDKLKAGTFSYYKFRQSLQFRNLKIREVHELFYTGKPEHLNSEDFADILLGRNINYNEKEACDKLFNFLNAKTKFKPCTKYNYLGFFILKYVLLEANKNEDDRAKIQAEFKEVKVETAFDKVTELMSIQDIQDKKYFIRNNRLETMLDEDDNYTKIDAKLLKRLLIPIVEKQ